MDIQVTTSGPAHWAVAADLADNSKASKQGWGQTKIGQVLQAKVRCMHVLAAASSGQSARPLHAPFILPCAPHQPIPDVKPLTRPGLGRTA